MYFVFNYTFPKEIMFFIAVFSSVWWMTIKSKWLIHLLSAKDYVMLNLWSLSILNLIKTVFRFDNAILDKTHVTSLVFSQSNDWTKWIIQCCRHFCKSFNILENELRNKFAREVNWGSFFLRIGSFYVDIILLKCFLLFTKALLRICLQRMALETISAAYIISFLEKGVFSKKFVHNQ